MSRCGSLSRLCCCLLLTFPVFGIISGRDHMAEGHTLGFLGHAVIASSPHCQFLCLIWGGRVDLPAAMYLKQLGSGKV